MIKFRLEEPRVRNQEPALVIGIPGLLRLDENNRVKEMLEELRKNGYHTLLFNIANITESEDGKLLESRPHLHAGYLTERIEKVRHHLNLPPSRTALIANSISAIPTTRHLMIASPELPAVYASFSPLPGWPYFLTPEARKPFELGSADISVSTPLDKQNGIRRVIPRDFVPELMKIDCLEELRARGYQPDGNMVVVTVMGKKDNIVSPDAIIKYHEALGGTAQTLTRCDSGHDVPGTNHYITESIRKRLPLR